MKRLLLILIIAISALYPQNITVDNNKDFDKALSLYNSKKYSDALDLFKKIESRTDNNTKNSVSGFFVSKILIEQKKYTEAEKSANNFLLKYPNSKYADEVKNLLIKNYVEQSDYNKAFESCINFLESSNSIVFKKETKSIAEKIALNNLKSSEVEKLVDKNPALTSFLLLLTGKLYLAEGDNADALKKFSEITSKHISSDEYVEALNLKKNYSSLQSNSTYPIVGVLLSLTDENGREIDAAKEILEGIKYAFHEYNSDHSEKIGIVISDIQRDKTKIIEAANNFIENNDVRCIIGPVFSDDVRNALKEIDRSNLCLISPTATDDDLVSLSEKFYQANPSLTDRGKIFAQYLYYVENKRSLAVLNSIEGYSPLLAASFSQEFERLGGKIAAKETYKSKSFSLAEQMTRITSISSSIGGIYAPISDGSDAKAILSQMVQSGLNIDIYGNQDWFLGKGFESSPEISNKLTFDSDYFIDFNDNEFMQFSSLFKKISGMEINRNVLYGYDTAKYILTVLRNIDPTRKNIKYKMESGISVTGFHNNISFDLDRSNKFINIVRFNDGVFELVDKFRSGY
ncbi:MAG: ABC transporter substrate-binding protein [Ignavibacteriales bacterium]|nr:ABC transporter substrate-binding protein [Ignavibacteriales bacterium]